MPQSGSPGGRRRRRRINNHHSSNFGAESKRNSSSDLHNRSVSITSLNSSMGSTTTHETADPDGFDVWGSTNSAKDFAAVPRQDPHVLVPVETKSTALPSSRERADALRYALGASGANVDGLAEAGARPPTSKARLNLRFGNRPRDGGGGRTSGGGGSGTGMFPSFPLPRQASSPAMAFNPSRVVADISRAVKAKAHARLSRTSDGNHQFVDEAELGDDALSEWLPATTADGRAYFWNPVTRKARWTKLQPGAHSRSSHALLQSIDHTSSTTLGGVSAEVTKAQKLQSAWRGYRARKDFQNARRSIEDFLEAITGSRRPGVLGDKEKRIQKKNQERRLKKQQRRAAVLIQRAFRGARARQRVLLLLKMKMAFQLHSLWSQRPDVKGYEDRPVQAAVLARDYACARALLRAKADPDGRTRVRTLVHESVQTPVGHSSHEIGGTSASSFTSPHKAASSAESGKEIMLSEKDDRVLTPLALAAKAGDIAAITLLLNAGADLSLVSVCARPPKPVAELESMWGSSAPSNAAIAAHAARLDMDAQRAQIERDRQARMRVDRREFFREDSDAAGMGDAPHRAKLGVGPRNTKIFAAMQAARLEGRTLPRRPPASQVETVLWRFHQTLIPEIVLDAYYSGKFVVHQGPALSTAVLMDSKRRREGKVSASATAPNFLPKLQLQKGSRPTGASHSPKTSALIGLAETLGSRDRTLIHNLATFVAKVVLERSRVAIENVSALRRLYRQEVDGSISDRQMDTVRQLDWRQAAQLYRLRRCAELVAAEEPGVYSQPLKKRRGSNSSSSHPISRKHSRNSSASRRNSSPSVGKSSSSGNPAPPVMTVMSHWAFQAQTSFILTRALQHVTWSADAAGRWWGSASSGRHPTQGMKIVDSVQPRQPGIVRWQVPRRARRSPPPPPRQRGISPMAYARRMFMTPRVEAQSQRRDKAMKTAMAKLHGETLQSSGPPKKIESVWGVIITQSTAVIPRRPQRYREAASLFDKLTQSSHNMMRALIAERREQLAKQRAAVKGKQAGRAAELMASLASSSKLEIDASDGDGRVLNAHFAQKKLQRIGLQLESLFGSANARLKNKAAAEKARAEREGGAGTGGPSSPGVEVRPLSKIRQKKIAGGAARQMQKLFRRRKARQMFEHLKHLRSNPHDIPVVNTRPFKLSKMSFETGRGERSRSRSRSRSRGSHAAFDGSTGSDSEQDDVGGTTAQPPRSNRPGLSNAGDSSTRNTELAAAQRRRHGLREFLLHKCVSGDVAHVCEELSLFSLSLANGAANCETPLEGEDNHFSYIDAELMRQIVAIASAGGHLPIVQLVVESLRFDPRTILEVGSKSTALLYAAENGHAGLVTYLANVQPPRPSQQPDVWKRAELGSERPVYAKAIDARLQPGNVGVVHERLPAPLYGGHGALHLAVQGSHVETVRALIDAKVRPDEVAFLPVRFLQDQGEYELVYTATSRAGSRSTSPSAVGSSTQKSSTQKLRRVGSKSLEVLPGHQGDCDRLSLMAVSPLSIACSNIVATQSAAQQKKAHEVFDLLLDAKASVHVCSLPTHLQNLNRTTAVASSSGGQGGESGDDPSRSASSVSSQGVESDDDAESQQEYGQRHQRSPSRQDNAELEGAVHVVNQSALYYAVKNFRVRLVRRLLEAGADADATVSFVENAGMYGSSVGKARSARNSPSNARSQQSASISSGSMDSSRTREDACRFPLTHFAAAAYNPNISSSAAAGSLEPGFPSMSDQVIATIDTLLRFSTLADQEKAEENKDGIVVQHVSKTEPSALDELTVATADLSPLTSPTNHKPPGQQFGQAGAEGIVAAMVDAEEEAHSVMHAETLRQRDNRRAAIRRRASKLVGERERSLLDIALEQGNFQLARWLCEDEQGLEPTKQSREICSDIHRKRLVDLRLPDYDAMLEACEENDVATVKACVRGGARPHYLDPSDGKTPLMAACSFGCEAVVDALLTLEPTEHRGPPMEVSVAHQARDGTTALLLAAYRGLTGIVQALLEFAVKHDQDKHEWQLLQQVLLTRLPNGSDALMAAIQARQSAVVEMLLAHGADANATKPGGISPVYIAAGAGQVDMLKLLLSPPPSRVSSFREQNAFGSSRTADVNVLTDRGSSALHVAAQGSHVETVELLLNAGADLNVKSNSGSTPLALAVFHCDPRLVELLLRQPGVVLDNQLSQGNTEAMMAAFCGDVDILTMLLDAGASATKINDEGSSVESILRVNHNLTVDEAREKAFKLRAAARGGEGDSQARGGGAYSDFDEAGREAFGMCDTSGDGLITVDELAVFMRLVIDPEEMRGEQFRTFVHNEFNRLDHDGGGDIDFAEFRSCFGRYYRPYKALRFGEYAKEAFLLCVEEQLKTERPGEPGWLELELARIDAGGQETMEEVSINKQAFATFINLVADKSVLRRATSNFAHVLKRRQSSSAAKVLRQQAQKKKGLPRNLLDGSNPKFEALVDREFSILDLDESGTIELSEFHSCFGRYYRSFLPHSKLQNADAQSN